MYCDINILKYALFVADHTDITLSLVVMTTQRGCGQLTTISHSDYLLDIWQTLMWVPEHIWFISIMIEYYNGKNNVRYSAYIHTTII